MLIRSLLPLLVLVLAACSQTPRQIPTSPVNTGEAPDSWTLRAKLGIRAPGNNGSATLNWQQQGEQYRLRLQAPLGQGSATISGTPNAISIERPGKATVNSRSPEQLIEQTFGWTLSPDNLRYWVRGLEHPQLTSESAERNDTGQLVLLRQSGWDISLSRYQVIQGWLLPQKIRAINKDTTLTLIIKDWQF